MAYAACSVIHGQAPLAHNLRGFVFTGGVLRELKAAGHTGGGGAHGLKDIGIAGINGNPQLGYDIAGIDGNGDRMVAYLLLIIGFVFSVNITARLGFTALGGLQATQARIIMLIVLHHLLRDLEFICYAGVEDFRILYRDILLGARPGDIGFPQLGFRCAEVGHVVELHLPEFFRALGNHVHLVAARLQLDFAGVHVGGCERVVELTVAEEVQRNAGGLVFYVDGRLGLDFPDHLDDGAYGGLVHKFQRPSLAGESDYCEKQCGQPYETALAHYFRLIFLL